MKDAWPVQAKGSGGRHYRGDNVDQNFDNYSVEYTFADGTKLFLEGRYIDRLPPGIRQLRPRHQGLGGHLHGRPHAGPVPHLQGPEPRSRTTSSGTYPPAGAEPLPAGVGPPDRRPSARTSRTTRPSAAPRPAWSPRWAAWPPTPARSSPASEMLNCEHEFAPDVDKLTMDSAGAAAGRHGRQVPGAAAGHQNAGRRPPGVSRILIDGGYIRRPTRRCISEVRETVTGTSTELHATELRQNA